MNYKNKPTQTTIIFISLALVLLLGACAPSAGTPAAPSDPLAGTAWRLVEINNQQPPVGAEVSLEFDQGRVGGRAGCNSYGGDYSLGSGNSFSTGEIVRTLMACDNPPGIMQLEDAFLEALQAATAYNLNGEKLEISGGGASLVLERNGS